MFNSIDRKPSETSQSTERTACNFQHFFKIQMMKKQRKTAHLNTDIQQIKGRQVIKIAQRSSKIINLLLNCPHKDPYPHKSVEIASNAPATNTHKNTAKLRETLRGQKYLMQGITTSRNQQTISHTEIRTGDGIWKIKQLSKAFDKQKLSLLQRYKGKLRKKVISSQISNLLGTSISPLLNRKIIKNSLSITRQHLKQSHKASFRYRDIPISQFIYENNLTKSENTINRGIEKRLQELCRRKNSKPIDRRSLQI